MIIYIGKIAKKTRHSTFCHAFAIRAIEPDSLKVPFESEDNFQDYCSPVFYIIPDTFSLGSDLLKFLRSFYSIWFLEGVGDLFWSNWFIDTFSCFNFEMCVNPQKDKLGLIYLFPPN